MKIFVISDGVFVFWKGGETLSEVWLEKKNKKASVSLFFSEEQDKTLH